MCVYLTLALLTVVGGCDSGLEIEMVPLEVYDPLPRQEALSSGEEHARAVFVSARVTVAEASARARFAARAGEHESFVAATGDEDRSKDPDSIPWPGVEESRRVELNSASRTQLMSLPRVGPATAERIVAMRPFSDPEQLIRVRGIGPATMARLRPLVRVEAPSDGN